MAYKFETKTHSNVVKNQNIFENHFSSERTQSINKVTVTESEDSSN